ncbi:glycosyltransferase involved in cell wall biosynthesis [Flavobacterium sp. CG_23.5]|uniref:glycosyltransferase family 2 protein n=1 Tax=Flavobacterium sp. CG_23.5 TaxID=2760708 RepID=UPI001ECD0A1D|nr:glycosyltransferase family 2 protein [Flavobacterium sp. CG_23.5]MBP2283099.1 glycosyltransferase involved in cell wall biosynthesis [Flavobacterium sp. CG_23.5]
MKISVCMATFNGEKFIKEQVQSIIKQLSATDEIIISDDGSTDETINIISAFLDPRIRLVQNDSSQFKPNKQSRSYQVTRNFENALSYATGDYIFLSDQDDVWEEDKVEGCLLLLKDKKINLIVHDANVVDESDNVIARSYFEKVKSQKGFFRNIIKNSYLGCCMVFDRRILLKSLPFPKDLIAHDMWIGLIAEKNGKVAFVDNKFIRYKRHSAAVTASGMKSDNSLNFKIRYRVQFILQYLKSFV